LCACWIPTILSEWLSIAVAVTCGADPYSNVEVLNIVRRSEQSMICCYYCSI
jgi:hypothetical protein